MKSKSSSIHLTPIEAPSKGESLETYLAYLRCYELYVQAVEYRRNAAAIRLLDAKKASQDKPAAPPKKVVPRPIDPIAKAAAKRGKNRKKRVRRKLRKAEEKAKLTSVLAKVASNLAVISKKGKKVAPKKAKQTPADAPPVTMAGSAPQGGGKGKGKAKSTPLVFTTADEGKPSRSVPIQKPRDIAPDAERVYTPQVSTPSVSPNVSRIVSPAPASSSSGFQRRAPEEFYKAAASTPVHDVPPLRQEHQPGYGPTMEELQRQPMRRPVIDKYPPWYEKGTGIKRIFSPDELDRLTKPSGNGLVEKSTGKKYYKDQDYALKAK